MMCQTKKLFHNNATIFYVSVMISGTQYRQLHNRIQEPNVLCVRVEQRRATFSTLSISIFRFGFEWGLLLACRAHAYFDSYCIRILLAWKRTFIQKSGFCWTRFFRYNTPFFMSNSFFPEPFAGIRLERKSSRGLWLRDYALSFSIVAIIFIVLWKNEWKTYKSKARSDSKDDLLLNSITCSI